jgi:hypothetical protein
MSVIIKNISSKTLQINDLGDTLKYGIDGIMAQSLQLSPNETATLVTTDEVRNSLLTGDIIKFYNEGYIQILSGTPYTTVQAVAAGTNATALNLKDVIGVVSILAFVTATGAPAAKTLLALTTDYTVANGDITLVTDQSANTLVINYVTL